MQRGKKEQGLFDNKVRESLNDRESEVKNGRKK